MHFLKNLVPALLAVSPVVHAVPAATDADAAVNIDDFQALAMQTLQAAQEKRAVGGPGCNLLNARVRRDW